MGGTGRQVPTFIKSASQPLAAAAPTPAAAAALRTCSGKAGCACAVCAASWGRWVGCRWSSFSAGRDEAHSRFQAARKRSRDGTWRARRRERASSEPGSQTLCPRLVRAACSGPTPAQTCRSAGHEGSTWTHPQHGRRASAGRRGSGTAAEAGREGAARL